LHFMLFKLIKNYEKTTYFFNTNLFVIHNK